MRTGKKRTVRRKRGRLQESIRITVRDLLFSLLKANNIRLGKRGDPSTVNQTDVENVAKRLASEITRERNNIFQAARAKNTIASSGNYIDTLVSFLEVDLTNSEIERFKNSVPRADLLNG